jgi:hypothetical protein
MKVTLIRTDKKNVPHVTVNTIEKLMTRMQTDRKQQTVQALRRHLPMRVSLGWHFKDMHLLPRVYPAVELTKTSNGDLIFLMEGMGRVKLWQGSVGVGYAYNWVPVSGLLVNVMAMPMLTFVNRLKAFGYETNLLEMMDDPKFWDTTISYDEWDEWYYENIRIAPTGNQTFNSGLSIGFDGRMSVTYNIGRFFFNAYGQFNNIRYHHQNTNGYLNHWFVNTSIGLRL